MGPEEGDIIGVGVSGGADSMVLLRTLNDLGFPVVALHVNFRLRGSESEEDARFVAEWCEAQAIPCLVYAESAEAFAESYGCNIQAAARIIRYAWWRRLVQDGRVAWVATAHHLDDNLETIYMRLLRGTGFHGLQGIPPVRDRWIRPMLDLTAAEIREHANTLGIPYREDSSNRTDKYLRNRVRQVLVPILDQLNPNHRQSMQQTLTRIQAEAAAWQAVSPLTVRQAGDGFHLDCPDDALAFLCEWLEARGIPWPLAHDFLAGGSSARTLRHGSWILAREAQARYAFYPDTISPEGVLSGPGQFPVGQWVLTIERVEVPEDLVADSDKFNVYIGQEALKWPLQVSAPQAGDQMQPFGMHGKHKKVQDMMTDAKWSAYRKSQAVVVRTAGEILWIPGLHVSESVRIRAGDRHAWRLSCRSLAGEDSSVD